MARKKILSKEDRINKEVERLTSILKDIDKDKMSTAEGIIEEVAFMRATLEDLKVIINRDGCIDEMPQGEYSILRESPAVKTYNTMIQRYSSMCKQLFDLLPEKTQVIEDDGFDAFVMSR